MYKIEFPDYDDILRIPKGFKDCSYHNDICPNVSKIYSREETEIRFTIWQDYINLDKREYYDSKRFAFQIEVNSELIFEYKTDVWEEIEKLLPCLIEMYGWKEETK